MLCRPIFIAGCVLLSVNKMFLSETIFNLFKETINGSSFVIGAFDFVVSVFVVLLSVLLSVSHLSCSQLPFLFLETVLARPVSLMVSISILFCVYLISLMASSSNEAELSFLFSLRCKAVNFLILKSFREILSMPEISSLDKVSDSKSARSRSIV